MLLSFELSLGDSAEHTSIQLPVMILELIEDLVDEAVDFILIPFVENRERMRSNKTLGQNMCFSSQV